MARYENAPSPPTQRESAREYILDMLGHLARIAKENHEPGLAIQMTAIREAARAGERKLPH